MLIPFGDVAPVVDATAYVQATAQVIGDVQIGAGASVWFHTVLRGDVFPIRIGARTNVQDNSTVHVATGRYATVLGEDVTVGHNVVLHGCTVGDRCLIGIGAIVLDGTTIGEDCLIGAGALLTPGTAIPPGQLVLGSPAKVVRPLRDAERAHIARSAQNYVLAAERYRQLGI